MKLITNENDLRLRLAAAVFATTLAAGAVAQGATSTPAAGAGQSQNAADAAAAQISDEQLENFAEAQKEVDEIRVEYVEKVNAEQDPQERASAETEMQEEMAEAVKDNDLDLQTYNRIAQLLPLSSDLQKRLQQQ